MISNPCWLNLTWTEKTVPPTPQGLLSLACAGDFNLRPYAIQRTEKSVGMLFPEKRFLYCKQEHTRIVQGVSAKDIPGNLGDGLITQSEDVVLGVTVADCLPILLWDPVHRVRGLLHSGWKGTGILSEAVTLLQKNYNTLPEDLRILFGPCIRACCYSVDEERGMRFLSQFGEGSTVQRKDQWFLDLVRANQNIARELGIQSMETVEGCTYCDARFHSFRRQGASQFQRMLTLF